MWKKTIGAGFLALMCGTLLVGCSGGKTFRVKGTIEGAKNGTLYLQYEQDGRYVSITWHSGKRLRCCPSLPKALR